MAELHIKTNIYTGPLDLLLFLVRRAEVDIYDLPVADIAVQYIAELEKMERVDLEFAGEYLVMAAQLLKVKSEMVLVAAQPGAANDPRQSLVQQLLEYKRLRDLAGALSAQQDDALKRHGRPDGLVPEHAPDDIYLDEINAQDIYRTYARLMREITPTATHRVRMDDRPISEYISAILAKLQQNQSIDFTALFTSAKPDKQQVVGNFLALLELIRSQKVGITDKDGRIQVLRDPLPPESITEEQN